MYDWISEPHRNFWYAWIVVGVVYELYTLWWNEKRRDEGDPRRANLTAYVRAAFRVGERRMKWHAPVWVLWAVMTWFTLHFTGVIP